MQKSKKIVCLGGGNAMPRALLEGLKKCPVKLSVISAMLDSGGSAGKERVDYNTKVSFGDLRRAAIALSEVAPKDKARFAYRYRSGFLSGHVMANLYCTASVVRADNLEKAVEELILDLKEDLRISKDHQLLPATFEDATLCAKLESGRVIRGEGSIDVPKHNGKLKIKKVFLEPKARAYPKAVAAIKKADLIVIGPGDLYSSLSQILLITGIPEAIRQSTAKKVYVCNLMTKHGETNGFSVLDFTKQIEKLLRGTLDYVIYNNSFPQKTSVKKYKKGRPELLDLVRVNEDLPKEKFIGRSLLLSAGVIAHDSRKLTKVILSL